MTHVLDSRKQGGRTIKRLAGYVLLVIGWFLITGAASWIGAEVVALFHWSQLSSTSAAFSLLLPIAVSLVAGFALVRWAWTLLETPGGSARRRRLFGCILIVLGLLGIAASASTASQYQSDAVQAVDIGLRVGVVTLGVILFSLSTRQMSLRTRNKASEPSVAPQEPPAGTSTSSPTEAAKTAIELPPSPVASER
jgi:hypothetical protein